MYSFTGSFKRFLNQIQSTLKESWQTLFTSLSPAHSRQAQNYCLLDQVSEWQIWKWFQKENQKDYLELWHTTVL